MAEKTPVGGAGGAGQPSAVAAGGAGTGKPSAAAAAPGAGGGGAAPAAPAAAATATSDPATAGGTAKEESLYSKLLDMVDLVAGVVEGAASVAMQVNNNTH